MRGHIPIIQMRVAGKRPAIVFINDFITPVSKDWHNPGEKYGEVWAPDHATVEVDPAESIPTLDLRFLVGLRVSISCSTEQRSKEMFQACKLAGATTIAACHSYFVTKSRCESGWTEIWHGEKVSG